MRFTNGFCWVAKKNFIGKLEYFFIDRNGRGIARGLGICAEPTPFIGGVSFVRVSKYLGIDERVGIIDTNGKVLGDGFVWGSISGFYSGMAKVETPVSLKNGTRYGYINKVGNVLGNGVFYVDASNFYKGRAFVKTNWGEKFNLIDINFKVIKSGFDDFGGVNTNFFNGKFPTASISNKFGIMGYDGTVLGKGFIYDDISSVDNDGVAKVKLNGKWGYIDINAVPLGGGIVYDEIEDTGLPQNVKVVKRNGKTGFLSKDYNLIGDSNLYDNEFVFHAEDKICVRKNGKVGFIDIEGNTVVPIIYDDHSSMYRFGIASIKLNSKFGFVDYEGKIIGKGIIYDEVECEYESGYRGKFQNQWEKISLYP